MSHNLRQSIQRKEGQEKQGEKRENKGRTLWKSYALHPITNRWSLQQEIIITRVAKQSNQGK